MQNIISLFNSGGPMMYPLAILSFIACVIFLERFLYLHRGKIRAIEFVSGIKTALKKKHLLEAITICDESFGPIPRVVKEALVNSEKSPEVLSQAVNATAINQFSLLSRRIASLALIAKISTLIGLMGTILALLDVFQKMSSTGTYASVTEMSEYIYTAIISSAFGLFLAILGWIAYSFLNSKLKALAQDIDWAANEMIVFILRGMPEKEDLYIKGNENK